MCSEFGMLITDVERERVKDRNRTVDSPDIEFGASHECSDVAVSKSLTILIFKGAINLSAIISQFTAAQH